MIIIGRVLEVTFSTVIYLFFVSLKWLLTNNYTPIKTMHIHETVFHLMDMDLLFLQTNDRELRIISPTYA